MQGNVCVALGIAILLPGCANAPPKPYWDNTEWVGALGSAVEPSIHYPAEEAANGFPSFNAAIQFTYQSRQLKDIVIVNNQPGCSGRIHEYQATAITPIIQYRRQSNTLRDSFLLQPI